MANVFAASSRSPARMSSNGLINVYCSSCNEFICQTSLNLTRALCEMCRRVENGEPLTPEAITAYELSKGRYKDVTMITVREEQKQEDAIDPERRTLRSMGNGLMRVLGLKQAEKPVEPSEIVAKNKQLTPLFEKELD